MDFFPMTKGVICFVNAKKNGQIYHRSNKYGTKNLKRHLATIKEEILET